MRFLKVGRGMLFVEYPKCSTCKKAKQWLLENRFSFEDRDIKLDNPRAEEIEKWHKRSQMPLKKFFNTSGLVYKSLGLKDKLPNMSEKEMYAILATDGMLLKRPIVVTEDKVFIGFKVDEWEKGLKS